VELGEIDQALDDVLGLLHETEAELLQSDSASGDSSYCEVLIAKAQVVILSCYFEHLCLHVYLMPMCRVIKLICF